MLKTGCIDRPAKYVRNSLYAGLIALATSFPSQAENTGYNSNINEMINRANHIIANNSPLAERDFVVSGVRTFKFVFYKDKGDNVSLILGYRNMYAQEMEPGMGEYWGPYASEVFLNVNNNPIFSTDDGDFYAVFTKDGWKEKDLDISDIPDLHKLVLKLSGIYGT